LGLHVIQEKIGDGADPYAIFKSRLNTGEIAIPNGKEYITSRILRISGLEEGFNKGTDANGTVVDTFARYVYIHGTNEIDQIGKPAGAGCVRLKPDDMIALFNKIPNNTPVYIYV
jgi:lipoprotein-anchoring transpeptidase ErfK/SrfK